MNPLLLIKNYKEIVKKIINSNRPYILYDTEVINENGISYGNSEEHNTYLGEELELFSELTKKALFTTTGVLGALKTIQKHYSTEVEHFHIGYNHCLEKVRPSNSKIYDVLFFGSTAAPERQQVLQKLMNCGLKIVTLGYCDYLMRDSYISASKIILNINFNHNYGFVSYYRTTFLAANKIACLTNRVIDEENQLPLCHVSEDDDLVIGCIKYLESNNIESEGRRVYDEFKYNRLHQSDWWKSMFIKYLIN